MRIRGKKPEFDAIAGEYVVPIRLSEELVHKLCSGWHPFGIGWGLLQPRDDGSYDLFIRQAELREDMNLVSLDTVQAALMAALDLATAIATDEEVFDEKIENGAQNVLQLVQRAAS